MTNPLTLEADMGHPPYNLLIKIEDLAQGELEGVR